MAASEIRTHEVTFCSRVSGWANALFDAHPEWPFRRAEIEESKAINRKRSDLRIHGDAGKLLLAGEVKMPGTAEGRSPYNADLVEDSARKADNAAAEFFFTWNVNQFLLFDRKKWHLPVMERRVKDYPLGLDLEKPSDVDRPDAEALRKFGQHYTNEDLVDVVNAFCIRHAEDNVLGNLKTEVVDVNLLEVPDPRQVVTRRRLAVMADTANHLAPSRTSDEKKVADVAACSDVG